jgi:hypothetical protein
LADCCLLSKHFAWLLNCGFERQGSISSDTACQIRFQLLKAGCAAQAPAN